MQETKMKEIKKISDDVLSIQLEDGTTVDAYILFTFNENGEQYIMYEIEQPNGDEMDYIAYGAKLGPNDEIIPINDDEWEIVERIFNEWVESEEEEEE